MFFTTRNFGKQDSFPIDVTVDLKKRHQMLVFQLCKYKYSRLNCVEFQLTNHSPGFESLPQQ